MRHSFQRRQLAGLLAMLGATLSPLAQAADVANVPDSMRGRLSTSSAGLTEQFGVTGRLVKLQGRFQSLSVARTQANGQVDVDCLGPGDASLKSLDKLESPEPAVKSPPATR